MKNLFALVLALVVCLSLCSCAMFSKYVGKYEGQGDNGSSTLEILSNGQYIFENKVEGFRGEYYIVSERGTWKESDGYLAFEMSSCTMKSYSANHEFLEKEDSENGALDDKQFELKGFFLYDTDSDEKAFKKGD